MEVRQAFLHINANNPNIILLLKKQIKLVNSAQQSKNQSQIPSKSMIQFVLNKSTIKLHDSTHKSDKDQNFTHKRKCYDDAPVPVCKRNFQLLHSQGFQHRPS